jgi:predicted PolB exonuclease-like 3'-5' exonuclease
MKNAFDIETIADETVVDMMPEPEIDSRLKDPEKIERASAEAKAKQIEKMGLDPFTGRVCSFSFHGESKSFFRVVPEISDAAEIDIISELLNNLCIGRPEGANEIITWNGYSFDFPFVYKRAAILRINLPPDCPPMRYWSKKYSNDPHCDLMQELSGWDVSKRININLAGKRLLGRGKTERDYATYADLIRSGKGEQIGLDNICDTQLTFDIYKTVEQYLF